MLSEDLLKYACRDEESAALAAIVAETPAQELIDSIASLLKSTDHTIVGDTCCLVRDLILLVIPQYHVGDDFHREFYTSAVVDTLEKLVLSDNDHIRRQSIYTLGKTYSRKSVPVLRNALEILRDQDPLTLPGLLFEIFWLENSHDWSLLDAMVSSRRYPTRWAVLETLSQFRHDYKDPDSEFLRVKWKCYGQLRLDENEFVRAEAQFNYQELEFEQSLPGLVKAEKRKQRNELERRRPIVSFKAIEIQFQRYLYDRQVNSYTPDELEQFIERKYT